MDEAARIPTNLRTLLIIEAVSKSEQALTATQINASIGLPKQTIHRLIAMLETEGYIIREPGTKSYRPSRRLREIGNGLVHVTQNPTIRHQILQQISEQLREAVNFVVPEPTGMHYLDRIDADWPLRIQFPIGTNVPFHATASGKCYMACLPAAKRTRLVNALALNSLTKATITRPEALLEELSLTAKRGYAVDDQEFMEDMVAIAVPLRDLSGAYAASLALHGPVQRLSLQDAIGHLPVLQSGAEKLQQALFSDPTGTE
ncbi:IclR family transcriptional regulator [Alphaproteobacteria bacterium KMM 3653]|uniref:IclR family transcriptional regulator n=1 Tax=Harenicola maris TaxID=2841044 RepID=A0AAP2CPP3_9RHOB|nr:IclR family transcriptional regulator [Harenicola maris]